MKPRSIRKTNYKHAFKFDIADIAEILLQLANWKSRVAIPKIRDFNKNKLP